MRKVRENILVAKGDLACYAGGQDVFIRTNNDGTPPTIAVLPGQLVWYDPITGYSINPANISKSANPRIVLAVGHDTNGDGISDELRKGFGEIIDSYAISAATAEPPRLGVPAIKDLLFKCTTCEEAVSINIAVEDDSTQNQYGFNRAAVYNYTVQPACAGCDTCTEEDNCAEIACAIEKKVKGNKDNYLNARKNGGRIGAFPTNQPNFHVVRLFATSYQFCLTNVGNDCTDCAGLVPITGITIDGDATVFTQSYNGDKTEFGQLQNIVNQINVLLEGKGSAVIVASSGSCPTYEIEINTCLENITLQVGLGQEADDLEPCSTTNPFAPITIDPDCVDCETVPTTVTYSCGVRVIGKPVILPCDCFPPNPPKSYLSRKIDIYPVKGFKPGAYHVQTIQENTYPENTGYQWAWREYKQAVGGSGRQYRPYNSSFGPIQLPIKGDRAKSAVTVDCKASYCSYILEHSLVTTPNQFITNPLVARGRTVVLIDQADTTTRTSFETGVNNLLTTEGGIVLKTITCGSDQDQDNDSTPYNDYNGLIQ